MLSSQDPQDWHGSCNNRYIGRATSRGGEWIHFGNLVLSPGGHAPVMVKSLLILECAEDEEKTKDQLMNELAQLRQRIAELEALETERKQVEEELQHTLESLRKTMGATIQAMALMVETRDLYTAGHQRRVANLARAIATEMDFSEKRVDLTRIAGAVHDLGKISISAEILNKPSRLTENEFGIIKTHPEVGYAILKMIGCPWPVARIVLQHHERMDGSGYPAGLSGEEILWEARVLAVADVVEAMSSHRPYRSALGVDRALEEISQNREVLYDPSVVDACRNVFTEKGFRFENEDEESDFTNKRLSGSGSQSSPKSAAAISNAREMLGMDGRV